MDPETGPSRNQLNNETWRTLLTLAFQSLGVVYGDLSTSPLYVYRVTFSEDIRHSETNEEIYGVLSLIFWTLTLLPLLKYTLVVLRADDDGEGGTFALYSLLCRHANVNLLPNSHVADADLSNYSRGAASPNDDNPSQIRAWLMGLFQNHRFMKMLLLLLSLIGACMVIGDGILTPALSVFSAVSGIEFAASENHHQYIEVPIACAILILLFAIQHWGTHRVGFLFAPVVVVWLLCISAIGLYNICHWNPHVFKALSPHYIIIFLQKNKKKGWMSLGGILLCMTGSEAMFADLGHFSQRSIKFAFMFFVYPSLVLAYLGQAAYLSQHHELQTNHGVGFYISVPEKLRWPVSIIAVCAAVVGSQAIITGTFSIIKQCSALGCFPRVKIVHTSNKYHGQIYIPEINWILMLLCLAVTVGFRDTRRMGNASGLAVITVMLVTTCLMPLVIVLCWRRSVIAAIMFFCFFGAIEALYFSASLIKFLEGAWVPVVISFVFLMVMLLWHYGTFKAYEFEVQNRVNIGWLVQMSSVLGIVRVNGIGVIHTELVTGIPSMFSNFVTNIPAFHQFLVFLSVRSIPVPHVDSRERFLIGHVGPKHFRMYRIIVRYGYRDAHTDDTKFEDDVVCTLAEFVRGGGSSSSEAEPETGGDGAGPSEPGPSRRGGMVVVRTPSANPQGIRMRQEEGPEEEGGEQAGEIRAAPRRRVRFELPPGAVMVDREAQEAFQGLMAAKEWGLSHIMGRSHVRAKKGSGWMRKMVINLGYGFLASNCRDPIPKYAFSAPNRSTLEVGTVNRV